jgi:hypothetical protein
MTTIQMLLSRMHLTTVALALPLALPLALTLALDKAFPAVKFPLVKTTSTF